MQASTNTQELPGGRAGRRKLLAVSAALVMALAALLLTLALSSSMERLCEEHGLNFPVEG